MSARSISYPIVPALCLPLRRYAGPTLLFLTFACLWFREYDSFDGPAGIVYTALWGNFRIVDGFLFALGSVHFFFMVLGGMNWLVVPPGLGRAGFFFLCALLGGAVHGRLNGGVHTYFDWREFVLALFLIPVFAYWVRTEKELWFAVQIFCAVMALRALFILIVYLFGGGVTDVVAGVRTPFFDGPTVSAIGLMGVMAFRLKDHVIGLIQRYCWTIAAVCGYSFVLLCFRRVYWGELLGGTLMILIVNRRTILRNIGLITLVLGLALIVSGRMLYERAVNVLPNAYDPVYAATNLDHVNDILDAFDHIKEHPIAGIGVGVPYQTFRIVGWKTESWGVHNAIMHVWLLYGMVGLITYLWFHWKLFAWLRSEVRRSKGVAYGFAQVAFTFVMAQFVMSLGFAPWPYGSVQNVIVTSFLFGSLLGVNSGQQGLIRADFRALRDRTVRNQWNGQAFSEWS